MREKLVTIYTVVVTDSKSEYEDRVVRFSDREDARSFAKGKTLYGRPAEAREERVPRRLADRWGVS